MRQLEAYDTFDEYGSSPYDKDEYNNKSKHTKLRYYVDMYHENGIIYIVETTCCYNEITEYSLDDEDDALTEGCFLDKVPEELIKLVNEFPYSYNNTPE